MRSLIRFVESRNILGRNSHRQVRGHIVSQKEIDWMLEIVVNVVRIVPDQIPIVKCPPACICDQITA